MKRLIMLITLMLSLTCLAETRTVVKPATVYTTNSKGVTTKTSKLVITKESDKPKKENKPVTIKNDNYVTVVITNKDGSTVIRTYVYTTTTVK